MIPSFSIAEAPLRAAVIGPGLMGTGIAWALAAAGVEVTLCGRDRAAAESGLGRLAGSLRRQVARGRLEAANEASILAHLRAAELSASELTDADFVIEAVPEDRVSKADVLRHAEAVAAKAILASTTSGLPITGLAANLQNPGRFVGLHFFSPAERMPLVEVVRGAETSDPTMDAALAFVRRIGKHPLPVRDGPGFFTTRVFAAYLDEAVAMVEEGVAPSSVEAAGIANGRAWGPLATLDETGLALNLQQARQAATDGLPARFCRPLSAPALARLVALGRRGRREGGGFFDWPGDGERQLWSGLGEVFVVSEAPSDPDDIARRLLVAEAMEALRCLEEGVIAHADDADAASILGLGFPKRLGGILVCVEHLGLDRFVADADRFARAHGERFAPSHWLRDLAARGEGLSRYRRGEPAI